MITTTLAEIRAHKPCTEGSRTLTTALRSDYGDTTPLPLLRIVDTNGIADALWALAHVGPDGKRIAVKFAADCAERVLPIWEARHPDDDRPRKAIEAARGGSASAYAATDDTYFDAYYAAYYAYYAYYCTDTSHSAAYAAHSAAYAAGYAESSAAERAWQKCHLKELLDGVA
ncbi:MAG: putative immunity protein [Vulcanimicrobiaceae bacterium]